jgi:sorbitol/mannitol transport system permease protein
MARTVSTPAKIGFTALAWFIALLLFSPILWVLLTAFKTEAEAIANTPTFFPQNFTLENFGAVQARSDYIKHATNSVIVSVGSTLLGLLIGVPAAWAMDVLMWMLSTKMMPAVGVLIPIYLIFRDLRLLDTVHGLTIIMTLINLPIIIWMLYTYFKEIPVDILEAARMDGAELWNEIVHVLVPMAVPGIASTLLLNVILAWNEAFWTITLTSGRAGTLTAFISSFSSPQGLFLAKLSAASLLAIAPILLMGWFSQKQLVRGLTFGAVK